MAGGERYAGKKRWQHSVNGRGEAQEEVARTRANSPEDWQQASEQGQFCTHCGAWRGVLGLEPTPELYTAHLVEVFREVRRVLRQDGVLFLNLGDSYAGSGGAHADHHANEGLSKSAERMKTYGKHSRVAGAFAEHPPHADRSGRPHWGQMGQPGHYLAPPGLKPLDLVGIPWAVAFALRADGWWLRSDIVWSKPNPMPESVSGWRWERHRVKLKVGLWNAPRDNEGSKPPDSHHPGQVPRRAGSMGQPSPTTWEECPGCAECAENGGYLLRRGNWRPTRAHDYVFLLQQSDRAYLDGEALREPLQSGPSDLKKMAEGRHRIGGSTDDPEHPWYGTNLGRKRAVGDPMGGRNARSVWEIPTTPFAAERLLGEHGVIRERDPDCVRHGRSPEAKRQRRLVHAAAVASVARRHGWEAPEEEEEEEAARCTCQRDDHFATFPLELARRCVAAGTSEAGVCASCGAPWARVVESEIVAKTINRATCRCYRATSDATYLIPFPPQPAVVLDPFIGSGTTAEAAKRLGRRCIGIDLNAAYLRIAMARVQQLGLMPEEVT